MTFLLSDEGKVIQNCAALFIYSIQNIVLNAKKINQSINRRKKFARQHFMHELVKHTSPGLRDDGVQGDGGAGHA